VYDCYAYQITVDAFVGGVVPTGLLTIEISGQFVHATAQTGFDRVSLYQV
jgi:hypothetical protein